MNEDIKRFDRINEYCDKIIQCNQAIMFHIKDVDKNHFLDNITLQDAVIMRLAVIGEWKPFCSRYAVLSVCEHRMRVVRAFSK